MKPVARPVGLERERRKARYCRQGQMRAALGKDGRPAHFALQENQLSLTIAPDPVLTASERTAVVKDVEGLGVEVDAGRSILIAEGSAAVGIRIEVGAGPLPNPRGDVQVDQEFELVGVGPYFAAMCHI